MSMRNNFEDTGGEQAHNITSKIAKALSWSFEGRYRKQLKLEGSGRRQHSSPVSAAPRKHDIIDTVKPQRTMKSASKTPELNCREILKQNVVTRKMDVKQTVLRGDIANGMLSEGEEILKEFWDSRKRTNRKTVSGRRLVKRNVNITEAMQTTQKSTTSPTSPSFQIPSVCTGLQSCAGRCTRSNMTEFRTDGFSACYCDSACHEIFHDCCADYIKYFGVQKPRNISIKKLKWTCESLAPSGDYRSNG